MGHHFNVNKSGWGMNLEDTMLGEFTICLANECGMVRDGSNSIIWPPFPRRYKRPPSHYRNTTALEWLRIPESDTYSTKPRPRVPYSQP